MNNPLGMGTTKLIKNKNNLNADDHIIQMRRIIMTRIHIMMMELINQRQSKVRNIMLLDSKHICGVVIFDSSSSFKFVVFTISQGRKHRTDIDNQDMQKIWSDLYLWLNAPIHLNGESAYKKKSKELNKMSFIWQHKQSK